MLEAEQTSGLARIGVNWKLLVTQIINFSILLWILKRYALSPVVKALDDRRDKIKQGLEASKRNIELEEKSKKKLSLLEERALAKSRLIIKKAKEEAENESAKLLEQTASEQELLVARAKQEIVNEQETRFRLAKKKLARLTIVATRKALKKAITPELDKKIIKQAVKEL